MRPENLPGFIRWRSFPDRDTLASAMTEYVAELLDHAINERNVASLMVSGGSTPVPFFRSLASQELDWENITIGLVDDRLVPVDHQDSNEKLVRENLLVEQAGKAQFVGLVPRELNGHDFSTGKFDSEITALCERKLARIPQPVDVIILGMGSDGHTASLFPDTEGLALAMDRNRSARCCVMRPPHAPHTRISLTSKMLFAAPSRILHICGQDKLATLEQALLADDLETMPIRAFLQAPMKIFWSP